MNRLTRDEAIQAVGVEAVERVEKGDVWFTDCQVDGCTEFSCSTQCDNNEILSMYVYIDSDEVQAAVQLDTLDWSRAINNAEFKIEDK